MHETRESSAAREPLLLYICGAGHSGSTLLDLLLGEHPSIVSVGEVSMLNHYLECAERICSCTRQAHRCPFWQKVMAELHVAAGGTPMRADESDAGALTMKRSRETPLDMRRALANTPSLRLQYLASGSYCIAGGSERGDNRWLRRIAPDILSRADDIHRLFDTIRQVANAPVVLDSSKHSYRLRLLRAARPNETKCVYLVRDGRAHMHSYMRREGFEATTAARQWVRLNRQARRMMAPITPTHRIDLTYEGLCRDPEQTLRNVCTFAGLDHSKEMLEMNFHEMHNIGGNRARFERFDAIREDTRWREEMSSADKLVFERIGGRLNRELLGEHYRD